MANIADVIAQGKEFGIFEFYLPFVIMFALFFGVLNKVKIFGDDKVGRNINVILSAAMSFFVMVYTPAGVTLSQFLAATFGETLVALVSILGVILIMYIVLKTLGIDISDVGKDSAKSKPVVILMALIALIGLAIFISSNGLAFFPGLTFGQLPGVSTPSTIFPSLPFAISSQDWGIIILAVGTVAVMIWMMWGSSGTTSTEGEDKPKKKSS